MITLKNLFGSRKSEQEIIQEIHDSFDNAQDELLIQARKIIVETTSNISGKGERLKALGFSASKVIAKEEKEKQKLLKSKEDARLVEYYKNTYPFLKFLKEEQLDTICEKYGLVYASVDRYTEDVPEKNLRDLENVQPLKSDDTQNNRFFIIVEKPWVSAPADLKEILSNGFYVDEIMNRRFYIWNRLSDSDILRYAKSHGGYTGNYDGFTIDSGGRCSVTEVDMSKLFIAAPKSHFDLEGTKSKGFALLSGKTTEIKDPIVFRYVRGGIQVLTKWGLEAEDPELQVGLMN